MSKPDREVDLFDLTMRIHGRRNEADASFSLHGDDNIGCAIAEAMRIVIPHGSGQLIEVVATIIVHLADEEVYYGDDKKVIDTWRRMVDAATDLCKADHSERGDG